MLETDSTRASFDPAQNGAIVSLVDKRSGREFIAPKAGPLLYELRLANPTDAAAPPIVLSEADALDVTVTKEGQSVIVKVPRHKNSLIAVECRFRTEPGSPLIFARITVKNQSDAALSNVRFPALSCPQQLGDSASDDFFLLPFCDGGVVPSPATNETGPEMSYPGEASMQLMAFYDGTSGIYLAAYDSQGYAKNLSVRRDRTQVILRPTLSHLPPALSRSEWGTEYDTVLGTFRGDWQAAADLYKSWALKQPWCQRTLRERVAAGDVPAWLTEPSLFYNYGARGYLAGKRVSNRLAQFSQQGEAWRSLLGGPITLIPTNWEKLGTWVTPDYFPPFGGEAPFSQAMADLHAKGHRAMVPVSGLKWTLSKAANIDSGIPKDLDLRSDFEQRGAAAAICGPDGKPQIFNLPVFGKNAFPTQNAKICPATAVARKVLLDPALECQRLGVDSIHADGLVGGGSPPCYSTTHGHPPGGGNWSTKAVHALLDDIRREGKKRDPNFALSIEEPGEFFIPVLDTYLCRDHRQKAWPRSSPLIGVPLFTHVYHEFMHGWGNIGLEIWKTPKPDTLYSLGMDLVCGKAPTAAVWGRDHDPKATDETQLRMLRSHFDLWHSSAREFLVFGQRVTQVPLEVPSIQISFSPLNTSKPSQELDCPSVLHNTWRLPDGRTGTVLACIAFNPIPLKIYGKEITLQPGEAQFVTP